MGYIETLLQNEKGTCKLRMGDSKLWVGWGSNTMLREGEQQTQEWETAR